MLGKIPFDQNLGLLNSNSEIVSRMDASYRELFAEILQQIKEAVVCQ